MMDENKKVTIKAVAALAGVSVATVSRYLNGTGHVNDETARSIHSAILKTGYIPNFLARSLRTKQSHMLLLIVPDISNPFYSAIAREIQHISQNSGYLMLLVDSEGDPEKEAAALAMAENMSVDGVLFAAIDVNRRANEILEKAQYASVGLNAFGEDTPFDVVVVHNCGGTNLAVEYLAQLGHRKIAFAGGVPGSYIADSRKSGYMTAMKKCGLAVEDNSVIEIGFSQEDGYEAGRRFAKYKELPTAICCANDLIALGVIHALNDEGIKVPEEISVTGMDDIPYSAVSNPPLTTVTNDGALFAREAFAMLIERIGRNPCPPRRVEIPNELIIRKSTERLKNYKLQ